MARLTTVCGPQGPLLALLVTCGRRQTRVTGIVDSGASRTLLPTTVARELDIEDTLVQDRRNAGAAGGQEFATWHSPADIDAQVEAMFGDGPELWGPKFRLVPAFAETDTALFGRADFFKAFVITFAGDAQQGDIFHLDS